MYEKFGQFIDGKWFDQVIIYLCIEGLYAICHLVMRGKHQNGCGHTVGADALTNIDSTEVRKIPVGDDEVRGGIGLALDKTTGFILLFAL